MKIVEVFADISYQDIITTIAEHHDVAFVWTGHKSEDGTCYIRILVGNEKRQELLDALQGALGNSQTAKIIVLAPEAALPRLEENNGENGKKGKKGKNVITTREELYNQIAANSNLNNTYTVLVILSTIVVAIGLLEDNVAVVIGAMVIAPLLGPNIALAFSTALGDMDLMWKSLKTGLTGLAIALVLSVIIGILWPLHLESRELLSRTEVGLDSIALAMASGAAAVISMSTGLPSVLVGVMVAVALLPPTATMGIMLGAQKFDLATNAGLLLAANIVSVNLAAKVAFLAKGIKPRTWLEKKKARQSMSLYIFFWVFFLLVLVTIIYLRRPAVFH